MIQSRTLRDTLIQAVLPLPMLGARWRWNAARSLMVRRTQNGKPRFIQFIRMDAVDLMASVWPSLAACQENAPAGPIPVPDHVLVRQTVADVVVEPLDLARATTVLERIEQGFIEVHCVDTTEPSVLAHGILAGHPSTFLDDAPLEERRTRAVSTTRGTGPTAADGLPEAFDRDLLLPSSVEEALALVVPRVTNADELFDLLQDALVLRPVPDWRAFAEDLARDGRLLECNGLWLPATHPTVLDEIGMDDDLATAVIRFHLHVAGPVAIDELVGDGVLGAGPVRGAPISVARAKTALANLQSQGNAIKLPGDRWANRAMVRRLTTLARQHRRTRYATVSLSRYVDFLARWQHVAPGTQLQGRAGVRTVIEQLQGLELAAGEWESSILAARVSDYRPEWLDELCLTGEVGWARLTPRAVDGDAPRGSSTPSATTPLSMVMRTELGWMLRAVRMGTPVDEPTHGDSSVLYALLQHRGALFRADMADLAGILPSQVDDAVWDLVVRGLITADAFSAVRSLLSARSRMATRGRSTPLARRAALGVHRAPASTGVGEGRWSLVTVPDIDISDEVQLEDLGDAIAVQALHRWGVVSYDLIAREGFSVPWRYVARALRRREAAGEILAGRFVEGLAGEQYGLAEAVVELQREVECEPVTLSACDPLNLTGPLLAGERVAARPTLRIRVGEGTVGPVLAS
jgi:ATP-dependent Lhr-like helicase